MVESEAHDLTTQSLEESKMNIKLRSKLMSVGLVMALNIGVAQAADQYGERYSEVNAAPGGGDIAPLTQLAPWGTTGLPPKLFPRSTVSWICDPKTGSFELTMKKQLEFKLKTEASVRIGPVITGTISTGR
jgi:hypothetical protein